MNFAPAAFERKVGGNLSFTGGVGLQFVFVSVPANGNETALHFYCLTGRYDMTFRFLAGPSSGICDILIDGGLVHSEDLYTSGASALRTVTISDKRLLEGDHEIVFRVNGKNVASSNYAILHGWSTVRQR